MVMRANTDAQEPVVSMRYPEKYTIRTPAEKQMNIYYNKHLLPRIQLEDTGPSPSSFGPSAGYTLDNNLLISQHLATDTFIHYIHLHIHIFGQWEEAEVPRETPWFLTSANHSATVHKNMSQSVQYCPEEHNCHLLPFVIFICCSLDEICIVHRDQFE